MHKSWVDADGVIHDRVYEGEKLDPTPVALPLRFRRTASLNEVVRNMVRSEELRRLAETAGYESYEESDDFDVGDDFDPRSPYEEEFEGLPVKKLRELQLLEEEKKEPVASPPAEAVSKPSASPDPGNRG